MHAPLRSFVAGGVRVCGGIRFGIRGRGRFVGLFSRKAHRLLRRRSPQGPALRRSTKHCQHTDDFAWSRSHRRLLMKR
jgi:hypothetical protein